MAKKPTENIDKETDVLKNPKLEEILAGFVEFRYEMNNINAFLRQDWKNSVSHYIICIACLHSRLNRGSVRPKQEAIIMLQTRIPVSRIKKVTDDLIAKGYLEERPLKTDKRKQGYWATDKLVQEVFQYLLVAWEVNYMNEEVMTYFQGITDDVRYLFDTDEGAKIRAAYLLANES